MSNIEIPWMLTVGEKSFPANGLEGTVIELQGGSLKLLLFLRNPTPLEIASFHCKIKQFAVKTFNSVTFFLFKLPEFPWAAAAFSICCYPDLYERLGEKLEPDGINSRWPLTMVLVDSSTGKVAGLGSVSLPPNVTKAFYDAIQDQLDACESFSQEKFSADKATAYRLYFSEKKMAESTPFKGRGGA